MPTHSVLNQPSPLTDYNLFKSDSVLKNAIVREGAGWAEGELSSWGQTLGRPETILLGFQANENPPKLKTHDRYGNRIDDVEFHPAWHSLMNMSVAQGLHSGPWAEVKDGAHVARTAKMFLMAQNEFGHLCPISMTYSVLPALRKQPEVFAEWEPRILSKTYDPSFKPSSEKKGAILGMGMTEKQGGSDVRANTTQAVPDGADGAYRIIGHKWFCSAPTSDAFLILAQAPKGLSCFLLPRWTPDGKKNNFFIQRLKDKLGNKSNASSEVEFENAWARRVGEEGRGVPTIIEMVNHTRLDCVSGSAGLMRQALVQALHHTTHRNAFGKLLAEQPLMQNVLADLALESEAATLLTFRLARAFDRQKENASENLFRRITTAIAKFWVCKRTPIFVAEALECLGGAGFVEEALLPRLYREAPLNSIWEGSGNVICLDVLRAMTKEPESVEIVLNEIQEAKSADKRFTSYVSQLKEDLKNPAKVTEANARSLVERLALGLQASLILRHSDPAVADTFLTSRLSGDWGRVFGTLPPSGDFSKILQKTFEN